MSKTRNTARLYKKNANPSKGGTSKAKTAWKQYVKILDEKNQAAMKTEAVKPVRRFSPSHISMEVVTKSEAAKIARIDYKALSTKPEEAFVRDNTVAYYTVINTWLLQIRDLSSERAMVECRRCINNNGLTQTITVCDQAAYALSAGIEFNLPDGHTWIRYIASEDEKDVLQILRFPKRFCPIGADLVTKKGLEKFYAVNSTHHATKFDNFCWWLEEAVSEILTDLFKNFNRELAAAYPRFSDGVCADAKTLCQKVKKLSTFDHCYISRDYPIGNPESCRPLRDEYNLKPTCVPKSYKAPRVIVEERSKEAFEFQRGLTAARQCLYKSKYRRYFDDRDQDINRELCRLGSIYGGYATIDLSSASDSISYHVASRVFPAGVMNFINTWRAKTLIGPNNEKLRNEIFLTSGNPLCFILEGCFFMAVALVATRFCDLYVQGKVMAPHIFGDDLVVDTSVAGTLCEFLTKLGCYPNLEKSFVGDHLYRESCGVEFFRGVPIETRYWPRKTLGLSSFDPEELSSLTSLQHRLYSTSWRASEFLTQLILEWEPRMTASLPGTECTDLWSDAPWFQLTVAPHAGDLPEDASLYRRERHLTLCTKEAKTEYNADMDMYHYVNFLREGSPNPDTPEGRFLTLLGCKLPRVKDDFGCNTVEWRFRTR